MNSRYAIALVVSAFIPAAAAAQGPAQQGPMTVERLNSGWLAAPDFKVTDVDGQTSQLLGGYAGWIVDNTIFVGGGGYWMPNTSADRHFAYGGLVVQWLTRTAAPVGLSVKGLIGGGEATMSRGAADVIRIPDGRFDMGGRYDINRLPHPGGYVWWEEGFFVAEPQVDALIRLTRHTRLTVGAGYRFVGADNGSSLQGAVGTLGLQIGGS